MRRYSRGLVCHSQHSCPILRRVPFLQGSLLMLAMELMRGGSLRVALQDAELRRRLRWEAG